MSFMVARIFKCLQRMQAENPRQMAIEKSDAALSLGYAVPMSDVTQILNAIEAGDPKAASQLLPLVYDELRRLAAVQMCAKTRVTRSTRRRSCMRHTYACWEPAAREREMLNPLLALRAPWNRNPLLALRAPWNRIPLLALRAPWNLPIGGIFSRRRPRQCGEFSSNMLAASVPSNVAAHARPFGSTRTACLLPMLTWIRGSTWTKR